MTDIEIRPATEDDLPLVFNSWIKTMWDSEGPRSHVRKAAYDAGTRRVARRLVETSTLVVACFPEEPDEILSWACFDGDRQRLHFVYTKAGPRAAPYRRQGYARALLRTIREIWEAQGLTGPVVATHRTFAWDSIARSFETLEYDPFALLDYFELPPDALLLPQDDLGVRS